MPTLQIRLMSALVAAVFLSACFDGMDASPEDTGQEPPDEDITLENPENHFRSGALLSNESREMTVSVQPYGSGQAQSDTHAMTISSTQTSHEAESLLWLLMLEQDGI